MLYRQILESIMIVLFSLSVTLFCEYFVSLSITSIAIVNAFSIDSSDISCSKGSDSRMQMTETAESDYTQQETITTTTSNRKMKQIYGIRHGKSIANEYMDQPGNRWGETTFYDDCTLKDAKLSPTGIDQACQLAQRLLLVNETNKVQNNNNMFVPNEIDLIIISPLSRCIQTWEYGVLPVFRDTLIAQQENTNDNKTSNNNNIQKIPKVLCLPILRERVYTASDTGRSLIELQKEFNTIAIDWDESIAIHTNGYGIKNDKQQQQQEQNNGKCADIDCTYEEKFTIDNWWYHPLKDDGSNSEDTSQKEEVEWRPYGNGQYYAVPGEPIHVFQNRMKLLKQFIHSRHEKTILFITHWGVLLNFTGFEVDNCSCVKLSL